MGLTNFVIQMSPLEGITSTFYFSFVQTEISMFLCVIITRFLRLLAAHLSLPVYYRCHPFPSQKHNIQQSLDVGYMDNHPAKVYYIFKYQEILIHLYACMLINLDKNRVQMKTHSEFLIHHKHPLLDLSIYMLLQFVCTLKGKYSSQIS